MEKVAGKSSLSRQCCCCPVGQLCYEPATGRHHLHQVKVDHVPELKRIAVLAARVKPGAYFCCLHLSPHDKARVHANSGVTIVDIVNGPRRQDAKRRLGGGAQGDDAVDASDDSDNNEPPALAAPPKRLRAARMIAQGQLHEQPALAELNESLANVSTLGWTNDAYDVLVQGKGPAWAGAARTMVFRDGLT